MTKIVPAVLAAVLGLTASAGAQMSGASTEGERFYGRAEYLMWWTKDSPERAPLVSNGLLSDPSTQVFMGGQDIDLGQRNGVRLTLGYWLTADRGWGVEASGFYLPTVTERRSVASSGLPGSTNLAVPFFDPNRGKEAFSLLSLSSGSEPFSGSATQELSSRLWGADGNVVMGLVNTAPWRVELLAGFRYLNLSERFSFGTSTPDLPPGPVTVFLAQDVFDATNDFYGGQLGVRGRYQSGRWMADATLKVAVGPCGRAWTSPVLP